MPWTGSEEYYFAASMASPLYCLLGRSSDSYIPANSQAFSQLGPSLAPHFSGILSNLILPGPDFYSPGGTVSDYGHAV